MQRQQLRPWCTMECSQRAAWTTNRSLLLVSRDKAFPGRPTNSGSILPRAVHLEGGVIGCHYRITLHWGSAPTCSDMRPTPWLVMHAYLPPPPSLPHQPTIAITNYTQAPTVSNPSAFHTSSSASDIILRRLWRLKNNNDSN